MTIIVTGCAGFIGINFTKYWLKNHTDDKVIGIDSFTYAANEKEIALIEKSEPRFMLYRADICDRDKVFEIFKNEKPDCVVNFAAETHVDRSI